MTCPIGTDVSRAAAILQKGGLVAFVTETVYGLGADALNPAAVARVFEVKNRPRFDPLIVHVAERSQLTLLVKEFPAQATKLADAFWPGPLTLVLEKQEIVPDLVTAGLSSVAVRIPAHPLAQQLLRAAGIPVAAPSANLFGCISPTTADHVAQQLGDRIDYILDGGPCQVGLESTVLQLAGGTPVFLRPGGLPVEEIELVIGSVAISGNTADDETAAQHSPGRLAQHYAPRTPLVIGPVSVSPTDNDCGMLAFTTPANIAACRVVEVLSPTGDLREAATNFFAALRRLDAAGVKMIFAELFPEEGLGRALNDRLRRAAHE